MPYVPLSRFQFRAPLLPEKALRAPARALASHELGAAAVRLASPPLAAALERAGARGLRAARDAAARAALDRYARRAAFRPTPSGLWAGVGVGRLGPRTRIDTGQPAPHLQIAWSRLATMAQALLERAEVRAAVRLRRAPSLVIGARTLLWLSATDGAEEGE